MCKQHRGVRFARCMQRAGLIADFACLWPEQIVTRNMRARASIFRKVRFAGRKIKEERERRLREIMRAFRVKVLSREYLRSRAQARGEMTEIRHACESMLDRL